MTSPNSSLTQVQLSNPFSYIIKYKDFAMSSKALMKVKA